MINTDKLNKDDINNECRNFLNYAVGVFSKVVTVYGMCSMEQLEKYMVAGNWVRNSYEFIWFAARTKNCFKYSTYNDTGRLGIISIEPAKFKEEE